MSRCRDDIDLSVCELTARAFDRVNRRGGPLMRRGGRNGGNGEGPTQQLLLYGLRNFSAANYYATPNPGGEAGAATSFGIAALCCVRGISGTQLLAQNMDNATKGWQLYVDTSGNIVWSIADGGAGTFRNISYRLNTSDLGRVLLVYGVLDAGGVARLWVSRALVPTSATLTTGYSPNSQRMQISGFGSALPAPLADLLALASWRGSVTDAALQAYADAARVLGDLPATMTGGPALTHRWSVRDALAGQTVVSGQVGPATIADSITGATADVMTRIGSPTVTVIDPSVDGRKAYGVQGFSAANYLVSASGAGTRGNAAGFYLAIPVTWDTSLLSGFHTIAACSDGATTGWIVQTNGAALRVLIGTGTTLAISTTMTIATADNLQPDLVILSFTGTAIRLYRKNVSAGADVATAFVAASAGTPMVVGGLYGTQPAPCSIYGIQGGDVAGGLTLAQVEQLASAWERRRMAALGVANEHFHDFTADITAQGGPELGVPAQVLDRIGTDHLSRVGGQSVVTSGTAKGLDGFDGERMLRTANLGGIAGVGTGFWAGCFFLSKAFVNYPRIPMGRSGLGSQGWYFMLSNAGGGSIQCTLSNGAGTAIHVGTTAINHGQRYHIAFVHDGADQVTFYLDGVARSTATCVGFTTAPLPTYFGTSNGATYMFTDGVIYGGGGGHAVPTPTEIAASAAATHASGAFVGVPSKTDREWDLRQDIEAAGGAVPSVSRDRRGSGDDMMRIGAPLQVAQRVERVWSYETSPIAYAADGLASNAHFTKTPSYPGDAAGWWWNLVFRVTSQNVPSRARPLLGSYPGGSGFILYSYTANNTLQAIFVNAAGTATAAPSIIIAPADVGKVLSIYAVADVPAGRAKLYHKRTDQTGSVMVGYKPVVGGYNFRLGDVTASDASEGIQILGYQEGGGVPTFAQVCANSDAQQAADDIVAIAGMTTSLYSLTRSIRENGGLMPATILDRVGTAHLTTVGSPTVAPLHARAWGY